MSILSPPFSRSRKCFISLSTMFLQGSGGFPFWHPTSTRSFTPLLPRIALTFRVRHSQTLSNILKKLSGLPFWHPTPLPIQYSPTHHHPSLTACWPVHRALHPAPAVSCPCSEFAVLRCPAKRWRQQAGSNESAVVRRTPPAGRVELAVSSYHRTSLKCAASFLGSCVLLTTFLAPHFSFSCTLHLTQGE